MRLSQHDPFYNGRLTEQRAYVQQPFKAWGPFWNGVPVEDHKAQYPQPTTLAGTSTFTLPTEVGKEYQFSAFGEFGGALDLIMVGDEDSPVTLDANNGYIFDATDTVLTVSADSLIDIEYYFFERT